MEVTAIPFEKISFTVALITATIWLWRERVAANKKRDEDSKMWQTMYTEAVERMLEMEKSSIEVISRNTETIKVNNDIMKELIGKLK